MLMSLTNNGIEFELELTQLSVIVISLIGYES